MEKSNVSKRLKELRERAGLSINEMAGRLGLTYSSYTHYEYRFKAPYLPMSFAESLAKAFTGTAVTADEVMALAGVEAPQRVENGDIATTAGSMVPVFDLTASAGYGSLIEYEAIAYSLAFPPGYLEKITKTHPRYLAILGVDGDSMYPTLSHGDLVMVDLSKRNYIFDGIYAVRHFDVVKVKRLRLAPNKQEIFLISDNHTLYAPEAWPLAEIHIIGRVLWRCGKI